MLASFNDDAYTKHIIKIIKQALQKAEIKKRNAKNQLPPLCSSANIYWQEIKAERWLKVGSDSYVEMPSHDIELVIISAQNPGDRLNTSIRLYRLTEEIQREFPKDTDCVEALTDTLKYMRARITNTLRVTRDFLEDRKINLFDKALNRRKKPFIKIKEAHKAFFKDSESSEAKLEKKLRGEWDKRGGNQRTKPEWRNNRTLKQYAQLVTNRLSLAQHIKYIFNQCDEGEEWMSDLEKDQTYRLLSQDVPSEILKWAKRQVAREDIDKEELEPQAIACEMARQELGLEKPQNIDTLQSYFRQGRDLIKLGRS